MYGWCHPRNTWEITVKKNGTSENILKNKEREMKQNPKMYSNEISTKEPCIKTITEKAYYRKIIEVPTNRKREMEIMIMQ